MRKEIKYKLNYRDKGEDKTINILIDFIPQRVIADYEELTQMALDAHRINKEMSDLITLMAACEVKKEDGWEDVLKVYEEDLLKLKEEMLDFNNNGYFEKRLKLLQRILTDNKLGDNEMLMSPEFWNEQVEPPELIEFLGVAVKKDIDKKKA